jgi:hypothetical protein
MGTIFGYTIFVTDVLDWTTMVRVLFKSQTIVPKEVQSDSHL